MKKIFINLNQINGEVIPNGWTASVAIVQGAPGKNKVATGESIIFNSKQQAWDSISNRVESLDYAADEISFNNQIVDSFLTVEQMVQAL